MTVSASAEETEEEAENDRTTHYLVYTTAVRVSFLAYAVVYA